MFLPKNGQKLAFARQLRRNMTPQERKLWYGFLRTYPVKIYRQRIIDSFIVDFYCSKARLVIEVDGSQHYTENGLQADTERTGILKKYRLQVLRFSNHDVNTQFESVCQCIHNTIQQRLELENDETE